MTMRGRFPTSQNLHQPTRGFDSDMCATLLASAPVTGDVFTISFEPTQAAYLACQIVAGLFSPSPPVRQPAVRYHLFARHQPGQTYTLHSTPIRRHAFAKTGNTCLGDTCTSKCQRVGGGNTADVDVDHEVLPPGGLYYGLKQTTFGAPPLVCGATCRNPKTAQEQCNNGFGVSSEIHRIHRIHISIHVHS